MCVHDGGEMWAPEHIWTSHLCGVISSLLSLGGFWGLNSRLQAWTESAFILLSHLADPWPYVLQMSIKELEKETEKLIQFFL